MVSTDTAYRWHWHGKHVAAWCEPTLLDQVHKGIDYQAPRTARFCQHNCAKVVGTQCVPGPPSSFDKTAWTYIKLFHLTFLLNFFFLNFGFIIFTRAPLYAGQFTGHLESKTSGNTVEPLLLYIRHWQPTSRINFMA